MLLEREMYSGKRVEAIKLYLCLMDLDIAHFRHASTQNHPWQGGTGPPKSV